MIRLWAVRHIPTGFFLPTSKTGFTLTEPADPKVTAPRLHTSHRRANAAMHAWLRGHHKAIWGWWDSDDTYSTAGGPFVEDITVKTIQGRSPTQMEVVCFDLMEVQ